MKNVSLLLLLLLLFSRVSIGQVNENLNYLYFYNDSVLYGRVVEFKTPVFGNIHFVVDANKFQAGEVKFYQNETGFHANTKGLSMSGSSSFAERIRAGKINLYEKTSSSYTPGTMNPATGMYAGGMATKRIQNYYNFGYGDLKKATFDNLMIDLQDNDESMSYLKDYKSKKDLQTILTVAGGVAVIAGMATLINSTKDWDGNVATEPNVNASIATVAIGAGSIWVAYFVSLSKPKYLRRAIDSYNR